MAFGPGEAVAELFSKVGSQVVFNMSRARPAQNCSGDLKAYHQVGIALPASSLADLRAKRNHVRTLIKRRLPLLDYPRPIGFYGQGSVAMGTVIRAPEAAYDIDDGLYFARRSLMGTRGADMSALAARTMVWEAAYDERYADPPELRPNCVRVYYARGFHIDIPVYRLSRPGIFSSLEIELASSDWKRTDPRAVTRWFKAANGRSPGRGSNRQLARVVRYVKAWVKARPAWKGRILGGFGITKVVVDAYRPFPGRDDWALFETLRAIRLRILAGTNLEHPVLKGEFICAVPRDARLRFLGDRVEEALQSFELLLDVRTPRSDALACWDTFFRSDFFWRRSARRRILI